MNNALFMQMYQSLAHSTADISNLLFSQAFFQVDYDGIKSSTVAEFDENL